MSRSRFQNPFLRRLAIIGVVLFVGWLSSKVDRGPAFQDGNAPPQVPAVASDVQGVEQAEDANGSTNHAADEPRAADTIESPWLIRGKKILDQQGKVIYEGDIDLADTMSRIDSGRKLSFRNDGSVFQNRERRLPRKSDGYYREWVHPTPGVSGPGPQRVVTGEQGEAFYTHDHYKSFQKIR